MLDQRKKTFLILGLIAVAAIVAYIPALQAGFIWDDDVYVENNKTLLDAAGLWSIWSDPFSIPQYYPLVHTTYWVEQHLWGLRPVGYHLDNVLLHITSCMLLFVVVRRLALPGSTLIAAVFALHPVMVESVAWVTERKNALSMVFYLSALLSYLRYSGLDGRSGGTGRMGTWWWMIGFFACALTSKSVTFSLPFTCLLILWWKRGRIAPRDVVPLFPLMVLGISYGVATGYIEKVHVGAFGPEWEQTILDRCLIAGRVPWFYLYKLFWPAELTFIYERWNVEVSSGWQYAFPVATMLMIAGLVWGVVRTGRRGPLAAVLMFGGTLFPALGFIDVYPFRYSYVADHFQYHASLGIIVLTCACLARAVPKTVAVPITVIVLGLYGARTFVQCQKYENREILYESILADVPDCWFAENNLGAVYVSQNKLEAAVGRYQRAHRLHPIIAPKATPESYAHAQIGSMIAKTWSLEPALRAMKAHIELVRRANHAHQAGRDTSALVVQMRSAERRMFELRDAVLPYLKRAEQEFLDSIKLSPEYPSPYMNLGTLVRILAKFESDPSQLERRAIRYWTKTLTIEPGQRVIRIYLHKLHMTIADRLRAQGKSELAEAHRQTAFRIRREDPDGR